MLALFARSIRSFSANLRPARSYNRGKLEIYRHQVVIYFHLTSTMSPVLLRAHCSRPRSAIRSGASNQLPTTLEACLLSGPRLTTMAHVLWAQILRQGDTAVDATCGNGHDTLFMAQQVSYIQYWSQAGS